MAKFTGIYNADGTILGEIAYVAKKIAGEFFAAFNKRVSALG